jgi:hypothetical protein
MNDGLECRDARPVTVVGALAAAVAMWPACANCHGGGSHQPPRLTDLHDRAWAIDEPDTAATTVRRACRRHVDVNIVL